ncbi:hypothetical protein PM082_017768 [Marasmius tenuissimus]|nr:hypothetical protein PM082_017768 [Marasmius tenuissimus]
MSQNPEAQSFLQRVRSLPKGPGVSLNDVLQPSLDEEAELRKLFATDRQNTRLNDKYAGLVDVYDAPDDIRAIRARVVKDEEDALSAKYVMPLLEEDRKKEGEPCMVPDLDEFKKNWSVFTEGSLSQLLDWDNVVAAGGAVLACLAPLPESAKASKRAMRKYYHNSAYPTSDVDLFLYGMTPEEAEVKITKIYEAVRDSVPWDVTCVRTKHTVSIHSQYPYRSVQIVLRLYNSPAEILAGFDIDSACFAYDGSRVWGNPRSIIAMMRQCNTVDMTRRSPSYEVRLAKYSSRSFEVYVPTLNRTDVDPTIYERSITRVEGLARLLVFEKLKDADSRYQFLESRRALRGRPNELNRYARRKKQLKGDLKANMAIGGLEMNDYDVVSLHIPYGPGWDARRIEKLVYQTDLGMNSPFNPKNKDRRLHRHPAFFGTGEECLADCCECCPDPIDEDERKLQKNEDEQYIRGRISFIEEDPGRQSMTGSFKPIDVGEWSEQVYIGPTEKFFAAIIAGNRAAVAKMIEEGTDPTRRDHVGRMPLHVAIMAKQDEIACHLIDNGARITSRLADGRTALHLAAKMDMADVVKKLLERSKVNKELLEKEGKLKEDKNKDEDVVMKDVVTERPSSEDDWSSDDNGVVSMDEDAADDEEDIGSEDTDGEKDEEEDDDDDDDGGDDSGSDEGEKEPPQTPEPGGLPEDEDDEPDVFDVNAPDWDLALTPLDYAVLFASLPVIDALLDHEEMDLSRVTQAKYGGAPALVPLTVTMYRQDEAEAMKIIERLVAAGASSSTANDELETILSKFIQAEKTQLVLTLLRVDPKAASIINFPAVDGRYYNRSATFPLNYAISSDNYAMVAALLAYGAKLVFDEKDVTEALTLESQRNTSRYSYNQTPENRLDMTTPLIENALGIHSDLVQLLVPLGASVDVAIAAARQRYVSKQDKMSLLDWVQFCIDEVDETLANLNKEQAQESKVAKGGPTEDSWKSYCVNYLHMVDNNNGEKSPEEIEEEKEKTDETRQVWTQVKTYLADMERLLVSRKAKSYNDLYPNDEDKPEHRRKKLGGETTVVFDTSGLAIKYEMMDGNNYGRGNSVPQHQVAQYEELFEACWKGDNATIQRLCLPSEGSNTEQSPIQIAAKIGHPTNDWSQTGLTTLFVAVARRHWDTARLIFTISAAQYKPDGKEKKFKFNLEGFHEDDSDDGSEGSDSDSMASDDTVNKAPVDFVDVAKRSSAVQTPVAPSVMLQDIGYCWKHPESGLRGYSSNLISGAVELDDAHAFTNIFSLYKLSDPPLMLTNRELDRLLETIVSRDKPELLHEFIRRTGRGVTVSRKPSTKEGDEGSQEEVHAVNDKNKVYYGLNVHGKKRKDLAAKNDPNADHDEAQVTLPLVWRAAHSGSLAILDYLKSERPLDAYRYYSMCNSDPLAISLRRTHDLDKVLPQWLGWTINTIGESPLSAALLHPDLKVVKHLFASDPKLMSMALKQDIKFIGYNLLMLAIHCGCTTKMVDFLLSNGLSPTQVDCRGWNIYHILAGSGDFLLFQHFLKKLSRDVSQALLVQQSKKQLHTPLHLAVENCRMDIVEAIINFDKLSVLIRDIKGSLPLHTAVLIARPEITKMLLQGSPTEELHSENGVGDTPFEIATLQHLLSVVTDVNGHTSAVSSSARHTIPTRRDVEKLKKGVPELRKMIAALSSDQKLAKDSQLEKELSAFARYLETQLASAKPDYEARKKREAEKAEKAQRKKEEEEKRGIRRYDVCDKEKTYAYVKEAVEARPSERKLVHLVDVQKSVMGDLSKIESRKQREAYEHDDGLEPEEKDERKIPDGAMVFKYQGLGNIVA